MALSEAVRTEGRNGFGKLGRFAALCFTARAAGALRRWRRMSSCRWTQKLGSGAVGSCECKEGAALHEVPLTGRRALRRRSTAEAARGGATTVNSDAMTTAQFSSTLKKQASSSVQVAKCFHKSVHKHRVRHLLHTGRPASSEPFACWAPCFRCVSGMVKVYNVVFLGIVVRRRESPKLKTHMSVLGLFDAKRLPP